MPPYQDHSGIQAAANSQIKAHKQAEIHRAKKILFWVFMIALFIVALTVKL